MKAMSGLSLVYDRHHDSFIIKDEEDPCALVFGPLFIDTPEGPRKAYPIGSRVLTWDTPEIIDDNQKPPASCGP